MKGKDLKNKDKKKRNMKRRKKKKKTTNRRGRGGKRRNGRGRRRIGRRRRNLCRCSTIRLFLPYLNNHIQTKQRYFFIISLYSPTTFSSNLTIFGHKRDKIVM